MNKKSIQLGDQIEDVPAKSRGISVAGVDTSKKAPHQKTKKVVSKPIDPTKNGVVKKQGTRKPRAPKPKKIKPPVITDKDFERWFFKLSDKKFIQLTTDWNEENLKIKLEKQKNYDGWLNYLKTLSVNQLKLLSSTGMDILDAEAYAALSFWRDIMSNPTRISKIHKAGLTGTGNLEDTITELALKNDRYGVLKAIRNQLATKLQSNPGNRDTADLSKQLTEVMTQIADYERRLAPDKKTVLGELLSDMPKGEIKDKRPARNGGGHRQGSFASRITIKDVEGTK